MVMTIPGRKHHEKSEPGPGFYDQPRHDGYGSSSRPGTSHYMAPPRGPYKMTGNSSSMQDLSRNHTKNSPSFSSLGPAKSNLNFAKKSENGSTTSLPLPSLLGGQEAQGPRPRSSSLFEKNMRQDKSSLLPSLPSQGPPPSSRLPLPPVSPAVPKSPLGQFQLQLNLPNASDRRQSPEPSQAETCDNFKPLIFELPPRKDSLASFGNPPATLSSPHRATPISPPSSKRKSEGKVSIATAASVRESDSSSFYSMPSPTCSSVTPRRESKESSVSSYYVKHPSHAQQYTLSLSTQEEEGSEDNKRQSKSTQYPSSEHPDIDISEIPPTTSSEAPPPIPLRAKRDRNVMRLPSLQVNKSDPTPSPLLSPASGDAIPLPSPSGIDFPPAPRPCTSTEPRTKHEKQDQDEGRRLDTPDESDAQPSQAKDRHEPDRKCSVSPPPRSPIRMRRPNLAAAVTSLGLSLSSVPSQKSPGQPPEKDQESDENSEEHLCHSTKNKHEKNRKGKDEQEEGGETVKEQKNNRKDRPVTSVPVPRRIPKSAAVAPPTESPILPGYSGTVQVTPSQRPDSAEGLAISTFETTTFSASGGLADSLMKSSGALPLATLPRLPGPRPLDSPATARAMFPHGVLSSSQSPVSPPLSALSCHGGFPGLLNPGSIPAPAPGTPDLESPRKAPAPPSVKSPQVRSTSRQSVREPRLGNVSLQKSKHGVELENLEVLSPPMSPRSLGFQSTQRDHFDSIASHESSVDSVKPRIAPNSSSVLRLSPIPRSPEASEDEGNNLPDSSEFIQMAKSRLEPPPLSPARRSPGLPIENRWAPETSKASEGPGSEPKSKQNSPVHKSQTTLLQDGRGQKDALPQNNIVSDVVSPSVESCQIDAHLSNTPPALGEGIVQHSHHDFPAVQQMQELLSSPSSLGKKETFQEAPRREDVPRSFTPTGQNRDDNDKDRALWEVAGDKTSNFLSMDFVRNACDDARPTLNTNELDENDHKASPTNPVGQEMKPRPDSIHDTSIHASSLLDLHNQAQNTHLASRRDSDHYHTQRETPAQVDERFFPHPSDCQYGSNVAYDDYGQHMPIQTGQGVNDSRQNGIYGPSGQEIQGRPFDDVYSRSYDHSFNGQYLGYHNRPYERAPAARQMQRTYKPFVPGAQVPGDSDVSSLVATPLNPSLRVLVPRHNMETESSLPLHGDCRVRTGSATNGADWTGPLISKSVDQDSGFPRPARDGSPPLPARNSTNDKVYQQDTGASSRVKSGSPRPSWAPADSDKDEFSALPRTLTCVSSALDEVPIIRTFWAPKETTDSKVTEGARDSLGERCDEESCDGSSLHSSLFDNYMHSWNGDLDKEYRERYPQFFQDDSDSQFLGIADGGDEESMQANSPTASPQPSNDNTFDQAQLSEPSMDANWPLPAALPTPPPPLPRKEKRPPPLDLHVGTGSGKGWTKVGEPPGTPRTPLSPGSIQPRPKRQMED